MATIRVEHAAVLPRAPSQVFRALVDPLRQIEWDLGTCLGVEPLTDGPAGKGSRYRVHLSGIGLAIELEIVDLEPGARIVHVERWPNGILRHTFTFTVVPEGTRLVQVCELVPSGARGVLSPVLKGRFKRRFAQIAERLRRYLYAGGGQAD